MKHYGIWLVKEKEWVYFNHVIFCTPSHAHAAAQLDWLKKNADEPINAEVKEFPEY